MNEIDAEIEDLLGFFESLVESYDYLGTGSDSKAADEDFEEARNYFKRLEDLIKQLRKNNAPLA